MNIRNQNKRRKKRQNTSETRKPLFEQIIALHMQLGVKTELVYFQQGMCVCVCVQNQYILTLVLFALIMQQEEGKNISIEIPYKLSYFLQRLLLLGNERNNLQFNSPL